MNAQTILSFHDLEQYFKDGWENQLFAVVVFVDAQGVIRLVNKTSKDVLGYPPKALIGRNFMELDALLVPTDIAALQKRFRQNLKGMRVKGPYEYVFQARDGHTVYADIKSHPVFDGKKVIGVLAVILDVTKRAELLRDIQDQEERYRNIAEATGNVFYHYHPASGKVEAFGGVEKLLGYKLTYFQKIFTFDFWKNSLHPEDRDRAVAELEMQLQQNQSFHSEYRFKTKDGTYIWIHDNGFVRHDEDGAHMYGVLINRTREKEILEQYKKLSDNYEAIYQSLNDTILILDARDGAILDVNQKGQELFGYSKDEFLRLRIEDFSFPRDGFTQSAALTKIQQALSENHRFEWKHKHKDGTPIWVEVSLRKAQLGEQAVVLAVLRDISDLVEYREHMKEHASELESLNRVMVGREVKMIELKERIKQLEHQLHDAQGE